MHICNMVFLLCKRVLLLRSSTLLICSSSVFLACKWYRYIYYSYINICIYSNKYTYIYIHIYMYIHICNMALLLCKRELLLGSRTLLICSSSVLVCTWAGLGLCPYKEPHKYAKRDLCPHMWMIETQMSSYVFQSFYPCTYSFVVADCVADGVADCLAAYSRNEQIHLLWHDSLVRVANDICDHAFISVKLRECMCTHSHTWMICVITRS